MAALPIYSCTVTLVHSAHLSNHFMLLLSDTNEEGSSKPVSLACLADRRYNLHKKLCQVDDSVYLAFAGLAADGRVLLDYIRVYTTTYTIINQRHYSIMLVLLLQVTCCSTVCISSMQTLVVSSVVW
jgi:Proteasome subunit